MNDILPIQLAALSNAPKALAQAKTMEEVTSLRSKAEAALKYAKCAKLGLENQNQCAEFKLSCERKAGRLLIELGMKPGRPSKRRSSHHATILADLGINKSQSSRWQLEAQVPEELLKHYVASAREAGKEITAQGLLRVAQLRRSATMPAEEASGVTKEKRQRKNVDGMPLPSHTEDCPAPHEVIELVVDLLNHHGLLSDNLRDFCELEVVRPKLVQRRTVSRVLSESRESLTTLLGMLQAGIRSRTQKWFGSMINSCNRDTGWY